MSKTNKDNQGNHVERSGGYTVLQNWVLDREDYLTGYEKLVYMILCRFADGDRECFPSRATIAKRAGCSLPTAKRALSALVEKGLLLVTHRWDNDRGCYTSNFYTVTDQEPRVAEMSVTKERRRRPHRYPATGRQVGSDRTGGGFSQNLGVGSDRANKKSHIEQAPIKGGEAAPDAPYTENPYTGNPTCSALSEQVQLAFTSAQPDIALTTRERDACRWIAEKLTQRPDDPHHRLKYLLLAMKSLRADKPFFREFAPSKLKLGWNEVCGEADRLEATMPPEWVAPDRPNLTEDEYRKGLEELAKLRAELKFREEHPNGVVGETGPPRNVYVLQHLFTPKPEAKSEALPQDKGQNCLTHRRTP